MDSQFTRPVRAFASFQQSLAEPRNMARRKTLWKSTTDVTNREVDGWTAWDSSLLKKKEEKGSDDRAQSAPRPPAFVGSAITLRSPNWIYLFAVDASVPSTRPVGESGACAAWPLL